MVSQSKSQDEGFRGGVQSTEQDKKPSAHGAGLLKAQSLELLPTRSMRFHSYTFISGQLTHVTGRLVCQHARQATERPTAPERRQAGECVSDAA